MPRSSSAPPLHGAGTEGRTEIRFDGPESKTKALLEVVRENPLQNPPSYEKLVGDLVGAYSRRINIQHRLVYQVLQDEQTVKVLRLWSHYE